MRFTRPRSAMAALLLTVGVGLPLSIAAAGPAAAATCSGGGCDHQNPYGAGCFSGSYVVYDIPTGGAAAGYAARVRLWYSPACSTVWASIYDVPPGAPSWASVTRHSDGLTLSCQVDVGGVQSSATSCYTNMLYDGNSTSYATGVAGNWSASTPSY